MKNKGYLIIVCLLLAITRAGVGISDSIKEKNDIEYRTSLAKRVYASSRKPAAARIHILDDDNELNKLYVLHNDCTQEYMDTGDGKTISAFDNTFDGNVDVMLFEKDDGKSGNVTKILGRDRDYKKHGKIFDEYSRKLRELMENIGFYKRCSGVQ